MTAPPNEAQAIEAGSAIPADAPDYMRRRPSRSLRQRLRLPLMVVAPLVVAIAVSYLYATGGRFVSTDDAEVNSARVSVSSDIPGRVVSVDVADNQLVKAGQPLFHLNDSDYRLAVDSAQAQLAGARLRVETLKATYREKLTELKAAQDTMAFEQHELDRQTKLLSSGISSQAQHDATAHALDTSREQVAATQQAIATALSALGGNPDLPVEQHPEVQMAQAALGRAQIDLNDTVIRASVDGVVTKVEQLQPGNYITASTPVFTLVASGKTWVEADFKETDLTHMRPGQPATVEIDTYPDQEFQAHVVSLSPGTGSIFSLLPPENASGNWVKVVQRLPVELEIDALPSDTPLHAGLSANVEVDTGYHRPLLSFIDQAIASVTGNSRGK